MVYEHHEDKSEVSFDGEDSVGEDAELELSCALHDLALRVKHFEEKMDQKMKKTIPLGLETDEVEEDYEEIEEEQEEQHSSYTSEVSEEEEDEQEYSLKASPKKTKAILHQKKNQPQEEEEEDLDYKKKSRQEEWNYLEQKEELCEMKQHLAQLLQGIKEEAKALNLIRNNK